MLFSNPRLLMERSVGSYPRIRTSWAYSLSFPSRLYFLIEPMAGSKEARRLLIARNARAEARFAEKKCPVGSRFQTRTRGAAYLGLGDFEVAGILTLVPVVSKSPALNASP